MAIGRGEKLLRVINGAMSDFLGIMNKFQPFMGFPDAASNGE